MEFLQELERRKRISISDEDLYSLVASDRQEAERYFTAHLSEAIILRYELLHGSQDYYGRIFSRLSEQCEFTSSDIKDIVEWLMPSFTEVYFGADKIVGVFGRTPDDDPSVLEKVLQYQMQTQNNGYVILDQWIRDAVESGLGVLRLTWDYKDVPVQNVYSLTAEEFYNIPSEEARRTFKRLIPQPDGSYQCVIKERKVVKDQPVIGNIRPGEYIYLPEKDSDGRMVFECYRHYVLYDDLVKLEKSGLYRNVRNLDFMSNESSDDSMTRIFNAIRNYQGEPDKGSDFLLSVSEVDGQDGRKRVLVYDCYGAYDVNKDGVLERVHVVICNGRVLFSEIDELEHSPFFHISFYQNSYQTWKEGVADFLQGIQDLKTALIKQIIINTSLNNDRSFAVDDTQTNAVKDLEGGKKTVRVRLQGNRSIGDIIQPMVKYEIPQEAFALINMMESWGEQKTGITKYNQGLDADSLNKTATGISKIMAASQQRLRKMARDGAENGLVPMYKHLIQLNKAHLNSAFTFRITNKYYEFHPDDIRGDYDVQVTSNIGLQDKQLTIQNLMVMFSQILPPLVQMGAATPAGLYETAAQIIESMGFNNPARFMGLDMQTAVEGNVINSITQQLPAILEQIGASVGLAPQAMAAISQGLAQALQNMQQRNAQNMASAVQNPIIQQQQMQMAQMAMQQQQQPEVDIPR